MKAVQLLERIEQRCDWWRRSLLSLRKSAPLLAQVLENDGSACVDALMPQRCSRWILIHGPAIGSQHFKGALLVDAKSILPWAIQNAQCRSSLNPRVNQAIKVLPQWIAACDPDDESVTMPDPVILEVLQPYTETLIKQGSIKVWCPDCNRAYTSFEQISRSKRQWPDGSTWIAEWQCASEHVLYSEEKSVRWVRP
jgi:hypothetical protein